MSPEYIMGGGSQETANQEARGVKELSVWMWKSSRIMVDIILEINDDPGTKMVKKWGRVDEG